MKLVRVISALMICCCMLCLMACNSSPAGGESSVSSSANATTSQQGDSSSASSDAASVGAITSNISDAQVDVEKAQVVFTAGQVSAKAGETVEVPVSVSKNSKVSATDVYVLFDSTKLSYSKYTHGKTFSPDVKLGNLESEGRFHYSAATLTPFEKEGEVFRISFKVPEDATGTIPVTLEIATLVNENHQKLTYALVHGSVTVQ